MPAKQQILKETDSAIYDLKNLKKNVDYTKSQARHLENLQLHRGGGTLFDSLGDFMDMFKMARAAYNDKKILKDAEKLESASDDIMSRLSETKQYINESILSQELPTNEKEKNIFEEFIGASSDEEMYEFIDNHGEVISSQRNSEDAFIFDDALDDFNTISEETTEYHDLLDDFNEETEEYRNQQR